MNPPTVPKVRAFDIKVNNILHLQPVYNVCSVMNLNEYQERERYECMVRVGSTEFLSNDRENRKPCENATLAEDIASKNAFTKLQKNKWNLNERRDKAKEKLINSNVFKVPGGVTSTSGWQDLVNMGKDELNAIYECSKYMSDEVLAMQFKDIVRLVATNIVCPKFHSKHVTKYTTRFSLEGGPTRGYTSTLNFNGQLFESLGLMVDENQAEQSASENALRVLGFLPKLPKKDYLIQPYSGGVSRIIPDVKMDRQYAFTGMLLYDVLEAFVDARNMIRPKFCVKNVVTNQPTEFTIYGEPEPVVECICSIYGKFFYSPVPSTKRIAIQLSANEALNYFGVDRVRERMELRKYIRINKFEFGRGGKSAHTRAPSITKGWVWPRFCRPRHYKEGFQISELLNSGIILHNWPCEEYINTLIGKEMVSTPAFKGNKISHIVDLTVTKVDENNPNLFTVGTSEFSIKMVAKQGQIYSKQRHCSVDIKPGHNIRKLKCEYRISLPSLEIHLKAIDCIDVYYSNPPIPVVTMCGVVALFHDYNASLEDIYVLMTRRTLGTTFESKAPSLQALLHSYITPNSPDVISVEECTEGIEKWLYREVKLLSEMTMDSLHELMHTYTKYDTRWNELVAMGELPPALKTIQETCLNELKRRDDNEDISDPVEEPWELPQSDFVTTFEPIGIHIEDSIFCAKRAISHAAGTKVRLHDIGVSPVVDIPIEDKNHRGSMARYYLWSGLRDDVEGNIHQKNESQEEKELMKEYEWVKNPKVEHGMRRFRYAFFERIYMYGSTAEQLHLMQNIEYVNADGSRTKYSDILRYRINERELRRSKLFTMQQALEDGVEEGIDLSTSSMGSNKRLTHTHLPGGAKWSSYKNSLQLHCKMLRLPPPYYVIKQVGQVYHGEVHIGKSKVTCKKNAPSRPVAGASAAYAALRSYGYLKGVNFEFGVAIQKRRTQLKAQATMEQFKDNFKGADATAKDSDNKDKDTTVESESLDVSTNDGADVTVMDSGNDDTLESESFDVSINDGNATEEAEETCEPVEEMEDPVDEENEEDIKEPAASVKVEHDTEEVEIDGEKYKVLNEWTKAEDHTPEETYTVVNEWIREDDINLGSDEEADKERERREKRKSRKRRYQWIDEEDIRSDELDTGYKEQRDRESKSERRKKKNSAAAYEPVTGEEPTSQWARYRDIKGFTKAPTHGWGSKQQQNQKMGEKAPLGPPGPPGTPGTPGIRKVSYLTPEGKKTIYKKGRIPPLPARDAFRVQCLWMKLDDAVDICPMLKSVSQTTQFKTLLDKLAGNANTFLKSKDYTETVKTSCALDS